MIQDIVGSHLRTIGFKPSDIKFVPISGLQGENLETRCQVEELTKWYSGPSLFELLDELTVPQRIINKPQRVTVMEYFQKAAGTLIGDCVQVKIEAGIIQDKDQLMMMPQQVAVGIKGIEHNEERVAVAPAGMICTLGLKLTD